MNLKQNGLLRRKLVKGVAWAAPVVIAVSLPGHAQTSISPCVAAPICTDSVFSAINGFTGGVAFDGAVCDLRIGPAAVDFTIDSTPNTLFRIDDQSGGEMMIMTNQPTWNISGVSFPYSVLGLLPAAGPAYGNITFDFTHNTTGKQYQALVEVTREDGPGSVAQNITWSIRISVCV